MSIGTARSGQPAGCARARVGVPAAGSGHRRASPARSNPDPPAAFTKCRARERTPPGASAGSSSTEPEHIRRLAQEPPTASAPRRVPLQDQVLPNPSISAGWIKSRRPRADPAGCQIRDV